MCNKLLDNLDRSSVSKACCSYSISRIYALNLNCLHLHIAILIDFDNCMRIHNSLASTFTLTIMLFYILYLRILTDKEAMNSIMLRLLIATIVNTTTSYDSHITIITNMEIIVNHLFDTTLTKNNRYMYAFILCSRLYNNINTLLIFLSNNIYISCCISTCHSTIGTNIISASWNLMEVSNLF